ncbi:hypothetical protein GYH30_008886 [Glycine max]|nr:hypothetical protein GYH30_008886 [Glycine max]
MASRRPGLIALFDVDGTLTAPRKVSDSSAANDTLHDCRFFFNLKLKVSRQWERRDPMLPMEEAGPFTLASIASATDGTLPRQHCIAVDNDHSYFLAIIIDGFHTKVTPLHK